MSESPPFTGLFSCRDIKAASCLILFSCHIFLLMGCYCPRLFRLCFVLPQVSAAGPQAQLLAAGRAPKAVPGQPEGDAAGGPPEEDSLLEAPLVLTKQGPLFQPPRKVPSSCRVCQQRSLPLEVPRCLSVAHIPHPTGHALWELCPQAPQNTTAFGELLITPTHKSAHEGALGESGILKSPHLSSQTSFSRHHKRGK